MAPGCYALKPRSDRPEYNSKALNKKVVFLYQKVVTPKMMLVSPK
jgi:hypothetical protein